MYVKIVRGASYRFSAWYLRYFRRTFLSVEFITVPGKEKARCWKCIWWQIMCTWWYRFHRSTRYRR